MIPTFTAETTWHEKYDPAMKITNPRVADAYLEACVADHLRCAPERGREEALRIERSNLAYWAGYYDQETRFRVERLFQCAHPYFGAIAEKGAPTLEEALQMGIREGQRLRAAAGEPGL